jgi:4'-phosphopantetheinyl transferase
MSLALGPKQVQIWSLQLDQVSPEASRGLLDTAELRRAARFRKPQDGARWAAARAGLRALLGVSLRRDPGSVRFTAGESGKPTAADSGGLRFSVSHSHGLALYALAHDREVGVDVEEERPGIDVEAIARRVLPSSSVSALDGLAPAERRAAFFAHWTRHEASLKCVGTGLAGSSPRELELVVAQLELGPGWAAALAVEGTPSSGEVVRVALTDDALALSLRAVCTHDSRLPLGDLLRLRAAVSLA